MAKYTTDEKERLLAQWREGGESAVAFCREQGLRVGTFYRWARQHRAGKPKGFVKVAATAPDELSGRERITLDKSGWRISVPAESRVIRDVVCALGLADAP